MINVRGPLLLLLLEVASAEKAPVAYATYHKAAKVSSFDAPAPPSWPPVQPSTTYRCATGDTGEMCHCYPGQIWYGPQYVNEAETTDSSQWIVAETIEMMISSGLPVGYSPRSSASGKCWYKKGFYDIETRERWLYTSDPYNGTIGRLNRQCFCRINGTDTFAPWPPSAPPPHPAGGITGDPHFRGGDGDRFDFAGANNTVYAMLSSARLALNALFMKMTFVMGGKMSMLSGDLKTVHGSAIKAVYLRALTSMGKTVLVEYRADEPNHAPLSVEGAGAVGMKKPTQVEVHNEKPDRVEYTVDDVAVHLARKHAREAALTVSNGDFEVKAASVYFGWAEKNKKLKRLDVTITPLTDVGALAVAPHGLIGQTFDGDGVAVDGALDDYSAAVVTTTAMGEGAIEGSAADYVIDRADVFSASFKYSRFGAKSAAPRDATRLSGFRHKAEHPQQQSAGTSGDDDVSTLAHQ